MRTKGYVEQLERGRWGTPKKCVGCSHRIWLGSGRSITICNYMEDAGEPRNSTVADCTHYTQKKIRRTEGIHLTA